MTCRPPCGFARLDGRARADVRPAAFHRHYREALRNGARAWLAMLVGGALWFLSGWDQGPTLLAVLGPYCTLLAASPFPPRARAISFAARSTRYLPHCSANSFCYR